MPTRIVKMEKATALARIRENLANHRAIVTEAMEGYKQKLIEQLEQKLAAIKAGKKVSPSIQLIEPVDQSKEYEAIIDMLSSTNEAVVEFTDQEFRWYMRDEWHWREQFLHSNMMYSARAANLATDLGEEE